LLAAMAGVFPVAAGAVAMQGRQLARWPARELADWRAWCPQFWSDPFPATVAETAAIAMRRGAWWNAVRDDTPGAERVRGVLDELDLGAFANVDVRHLSGGERQRVAVATALLQGAPMLLLDEPVSHLDLAHQGMLLRALERRSLAGHAVVASLHDINLAWDLATHAIVLDGRGLAMAGPREVVMTPQRLSAAFGVPVDQVQVCGQSRFWIGPLNSMAG
jgi:iron complex transport system ATP-binding protein